MVSHGDQAGPGSTPNAAPTAFTSADVDNLRAVTHRPGLLLTRPYVGDLSFTDAGCDELILIPCNPDVAQVSLTAEAAGL